MIIDILKSILEFYNTALSYAGSHTFDGRPFKESMDWQRNIRFEDIDATKFFFEYVWVVLASGFKVAIARKYFDAFFESGNGRPEDCDISKLYNNKRKKEAIRKMQRSYVQRFAKLKYYDSFKDEHARDSSRFLYISCLPFIGPVTKYHLAKNLGLDFAKPDVHLTRLCNIFCFKDAQALCEEISEETKERVSVIDLVLWFYCSENPGYQNLKEMEVLA